MMKIKLLMIILSTSSVSLWSMAIDSTQNAACACLRNQDTSDACADTVEEQVRVVLARDAANGGITTTGSAAAAQADDLLHLEE